MLVVMAGLVPAISLKKARYYCRPKRDHRDKPGDDESRVRDSMRSKNILMVVQSRCAELKCNRRDCCHTYELAIALLRKESSGRSNVGCEGVKGRRLFRLCRRRPGGGAR